MPNIAHSFMQAIKENVKNKISNGKMHKGKFAIVQPFILSYHHQQQQQQQQQQLFWCCFSFKNVNMIYHEIQTCAKLKSFQFHIAAVDDVVTIDIYTKAILKLLPRVIRAWNVSRRNGY